jgi:hypothetical protein
MNFFRILFNVNCNKYKVISKLKNLLKLWLYD